MKVAGKEVIKQLLGEVPFTAELYWLLRQRGGPLQSRFSLRHLQAEMPDLVKEATALRDEALRAKTLRTDSLRAKELSATRRASPFGKVFIFATLHYWIEHAALLGIALAA